MKRSIFISRDLPENSKLLSFLGENNWEIHHESLIEIEPLAFKIEAEFDWLFISSSNGIKILLRSFSPSKKVKIATVGEATANAIRSFGFEPQFVGNSGNMNRIGQQFSKVLENKTVLFVGAEDGSEKIREALAPKQVLFIPIYRTTAKINLQLPKTDVVFLTSPSNAKAYLNTVLDGTQRFVAIGNTTAEYLSSCGITDVLIPKTPQEKEVITLLEEFI